LIRTLWEALKCEHVKIWVVFLIMGVIVIDDWVIHFRSLIGATPTSLSLGITWS
jgi:hypothetical protein